MKKIFDEIIKKHWITIWLIVAALSLFAISTYAIYTRVTIAKRVVSTQAGLGILFSSDHMSAGGTRSVEPFTESTDHARVPVNVFNYAFPKEAVFRTDDTEYELKATLGYFDSTGTFQQLSDPTAIAELSKLNYSISHGNQTYYFSDADNIIHTFEGCVITGGSANSDLFTLVFDKIELGDNPKGYCIALEASPSDTDLPKLTGYITVRFSKQAASGWHGEVEVLDTEKINDYDGYNYYLEGNGTGYLTFRWNRNYVTIDKYFLSNKENEFYKKEDNRWVKIAAPVESALPDSDGVVSVTMLVDSKTKTNRYEVQFYKVNSKAYSYTKENVESYLPKTNPADWDPIENSSGN